MRVAEAVGRTLVSLGVGQVFGVVGSGNFWATRAMTDQGARYVAARHEHGATMMADAYSRMTGEVSVVSLHQGCGLTNAMTAITEAAKSRTPIVVVTGDTPPTTKTSNFWIDQESAITALGAEVERVHKGSTAVADTARAFHRAAGERRTVVLNMALDVQEREIDFSPESIPAAVPVAPSGTSEDGAEVVARVLSEARRPLIVGGRGARYAREEIEALAEASGALLATSGVARGLFAGNPWYLDTMGGFSPPDVVDLITDADAVVAFGASLNTWTTRDGTLLAGSRVVQVDVEREAIGRHAKPDHGVLGEAAPVAAAATGRLSARPDEGYRTPEVRDRIVSGVRWQDQPFEDMGTDTTIDPRTATIALDEMLPDNRIVVPDGGNFNGYPAMFFSIPDADGYCLPLAFQSIGLAIGAAVGAAVARRDRIAIAGVGDGGFMMSLTELDTAVRESLPVVIVVYNDAAYGAEVHHFAPETDDLATVTFPETDVAAVARGFGCAAVTVRSVEDLAGVRGWVDGERRAPLVVDLKIPQFPSWMIEHSFSAEK
ncbi:thiamine pyrophosphate-binding protein [Georgenia halophila]|uniref:Thiamine pyrophosphate-binding protein n=1 Tax=Georgenia halophila TaxID=620889 RepID=A0ABP8LN04_9MICO